MPMSKPNVLLERYPYRFVTCGVLLINGKPDCRIQKYNEWKKRYQDMYLCHNEMQLHIAIQDPEYAKWLDPDPEVGAYRHYT